MKWFFRPKKRAYIRVCNVYCDPVRDRAIVAAMYNHAGLYAEKPGGAVVTQFSDSAELAAAVKQALDQ